ncbi:MAG TPA: tryptophan 2,3-dioxygenase family protein [Gemmatimonadaceae bacterium]|nr:tryptophan 2,3-dioxygenase family protein [Gemmatimonadaceae bacterium]
MTGKGKSPQGPDRKKPGAEPGNSAADIKKAEEVVTYPSYLALDELLHLQRPRSKPEHPDELLFIIVHQASELWFKLILHELNALIALIEARDTLGALSSVRRVNALVRIVTGQLSALETLPPQRFAQFRGYLGTSSGSQSVQFRAIEAMSGMRDAHFLQVLKQHGEIAPLVKRALAKPTLQQLYDDLLDAEGVTLEQVYSEQNQKPLQMLAEGLLEYEQGFAMWRFLHVQLVERIIGPLTSGTGGTLGSKYLQQTINQRFFPKLWQVRSKFFKG